MKYAVMTATLALSTAVFAELPTVIPGQSVISGDNTSVTAVVPVQPAPSAAANTQLFLMIEQLQNEVQSLRGLAEEQAYEIKMLKQQGRDRYRDLDGRILDLTKRVANVGKSASVPISPVVGVESASTVGEGVMPEAVAVNTVATDGLSNTQKRDYDSALALVKDKQYDKAVDALHGYIEKYPDSELTANAYYWLGEVYLVLDKPEQAKQAFTIVVTAFSAHRKAADSLFKLGSTMNKLGDKQEALRYYNDVIERFPDSAAAKLAMEGKQKL